jgi:hypothetical protein
LVYDKIEIAAGQRKVVEEKQLGRRDEMAVTVFKKQDGRK